VKDKTYFFQKDPIGMRSISVSSKDHALSTHILNECACDCEGWKHRKTCNHCVLRDELLRLWGGSEGSSLLAGDNWPALLREAKQTLETLFEYVLFHSLHRYRLAPYGQMSLFRPDRDLGSLLGDSGDRTWWVKPSGSLFWIEGRVVL